MPKIKVWCALNLCRVEDTFDYDDEDWNAMTEKEQEQALDQMAADHSNNYVEYGAEVVTREEK